MWFNIVPLQYSMKCKIGVCKQKTKTKKLDYCNITDKMQMFKCELHASNNITNDNSQGTVQCRTSSKRSQVSEQNNPVWEIIYNGACSTHIIQLYFLRETNIVTILQNMQERLPY